ncbi:MAG: FKBP-type peptidyl-prolyl cis-trans isomerase [Burkholderiales bacterium]
MIRAIQAGDKVALHYRLSALTSGEEILSSFDGDPLTLRVGGNELAPNLQQCLLGLEEGDHPIFELDAQDAFGEGDPELVQILPRNQFPPDAELEIGSLIEFGLPDQSTLSGRLLEKTGATVTVDFNHPLSDCAVYFEVLIVSVEPPQGE